MNERSEELTTLKHGILEIMESYGLNFGEMCGVFEDIKMEVWCNLNGVRLADEEEE